MALTRRRRAASVGVGNTAGCNPAAIATAPRTQLQPWNQVASTNEDTRLPTCKNKEVAWASVVYVHKGVHVLYNKKMRK